MSDRRSRKDWIELIESQNLHVSQYIQCDTFLVRLSFQGFSLTVIILVTDTLHYDNIFQGIHLQMITKSIFSLFQLDKNK